MAHRRLAGRARVRDRAARVAPRAGPDRVFIAQRLALVGRVDDALLALERARVARDPILVFELRLDPLIQAVRSDPRYTRLARRVGVVD
jgi:hypothetical protein